MSDESSDPLSASTDQGDFATDFAAFSRVVEALKGLDVDGRLRLMRTVATFFKMDVNQFLGRRDAEKTTTFAPQVSTGASQIASFSEDRAPSPKEFIRDKKPLTDVEKVACLAYYLTHYRDTPHFKTIDLSALNTEAAQIKFSNAAHAVDNATKSGLLVPAVKGTKQLSANGELYVQALPDRAAAKEAIAHARPRRKSRRSSGNGQMDSSDNEE